VASDGTVGGLADDYQAANPQRPGRDRYELSLRDLIGNQLGREYADAYAISFHVLGGREVGRLRVTPAAKPVYYNGDFYLRDGNRKSNIEGARSGRVPQGPLGIGRATPPGPSPGAGPALRPGAVATRQRRWRGACLLMYTLVH
jgi:hypothetical protein